MLKSHSNINLDFINFSPITTESHPFRFLYASSFFKPSFFSKLVSKCFNQNWNECNRHENGYSFLPFVDKEFCRFVYSTEFRNYIGSFVNKSIFWSREFPTPQIYRFPSLSRGLEPHTDSCSERNFALIFYVSEYWPEAFGGGFDIYRSVDKNLYFDRRLYCEANSVVGFEISNQSWHGVSPIIVNGVDRYSIVVDYKYRSDF
jgi:hypothetical protein